MSTRSRQVAAYRRSPEGSLKIAVRGRARAAAATWVREEHPEVWAHLMKEAEVSVRIERGTSLGMAGTGL